MTNSKKKIPKSTKTKAELGTSYMDNLNNVMSRPNFFNQLLDGYHNTVGN